MQRALDFSKTPALTVPLPFFLNAPVFALLAGLLAVLAGAPLFSTRWAPATLALTHLWTLGILASVMMGALLQILAVACNVATPAVRIVALATHALLTAGTLTLVTAFLLQPPIAWLVAGVLLALAFGLYLGGVAHALWRSRHQVYPGAREILVPVRAALSALAVATAIGLSLAIALSLCRQPTPGLVDTHVLWGLLGWGGLLLAGMSFQLLPIFQLTELYPQKLIRFGPSLIVLLLVAWTTQVPMDFRLPSYWRSLIEVLLGLAYVLWAGTTIRRLNTRKRPSAEPTTLFWYTGMISLLASFPVALWAIAYDSPRAVFLGGVLIIVGTLGAAINGMLYKILPFLLWTHAQDGLSASSLPPDIVRRYRKTMPRIADYLDLGEARRQWALHVGVILSWAAAALWPGLAPVAGALQILSATALADNFWQSLKTYRQTQQRTRQLAQAVATARAVNHDPASHAPARQDSAGHDSASYDPASHDIAGHDPIGTPAPRRP